MEIFPTSGYFWWMQKNYSGVLLSSLHFLYYPSLSAALDVIHVCPLPSSSAHRKSAQLFVNTLAFNHQRSGIFRAKP